jgi:multicomponent Na+:H+ antiporter subunit E
MSTVLVFATCLGFWLVLSSHREPLPVGLGIIAAAIVTWCNRKGERLSPALRALPALVGYLAWLFREVAVANLQVVRLVLDPRLPVTPTIIRMRAPFRDDVALTTLANSITLTPGTVTLDVEGADLVVHALTDLSAVSLLGGDLAARVDQVFAASVRDE